MIKLFLILLFLSSGATAGLTPGTYDIETRGGYKVGSCTVEKSLKPNADGKKITWIEINTTMKLSDGEFKEKEMATIDDHGLAYFKRESTDPNGRIFIEGVREKNEVRVRRDTYGARSSVGVAHDEYEISEYEIEFKSAPFYKMKMGDGKAIQMFSIDQLKGVKTVRNINGTKPVRYGKKDIEAIEINTNIGGEVVYSLFHPKKHILLEEHRNELVFRRVE